MDMAAFNAAWLADLGAVVPQRHGPQPAPPGPRPSAWGAPGEIPGATTRPGAPAPIGSADRRRRRRDRWRAAPRGLHARSSASWRCVVFGRGRPARRGRAPGAADPAPCRDRRGPPARHPELAGHARGRPAGPRLPRGGATRRRRAARPLHDPGAFPARRDGERAAGRPGGPQGVHPRPADEDPGRRAGGRGIGGAGQGAQRRAPGRADRGGPDPAHRLRHRAPARGFARARPTRRATRRTCWSGHGTCARSWRSCGPPARRPSRSTASG